MSIREVTTEDILHVARNMREEDVAEIAAASGLEPEKCLKVSVPMSDYVRTLVAGGQPIGIAGLVVQNERGIPWFLGTDAVLANKKTFLADAKQIVSEMGQITQKMENFVHANNTKSISFLTWLGFDVDSPSPFGLKGENFHRFQRGFDNV